MLSRYDSIHEYDRQTDGLTERQTALCIVSRDKNREQCTRIVR